MRKIEIEREGGREEGRKEGTRKCEGLYIERDGWVCTEKREREMWGYVY